MDEKDWDLSDAFEEECAENNRLRAERDKWMEYATGDRAELALKMEALRAELASRQIDVDTFREGNQKLRAELAEANAKTGKCGMEGHNEPCYYCGEPCNSLVGNPSRWPVALCHADEPGVVKWHHTGCVMERLAELAEWKERHPYGEVDLDMAIEAETKDLKLRIDTLESAQIDYEVQCAAKDASIKEEFDKYCRNLTELAQVHKESCDAKDARVAALEGQLGSAQTVRKMNAAVAELALTNTDSWKARAERAEARIAALIVSNQELCADNIAKDARIAHERVEGDKILAALEAANVRIEEQNAIIHGMQDGALVRDQMGIIERANARIAEFADKGTLQALRDANDRAERAEARVSILEKDVMGYLEAIARAERAEAERDALLYNAESQYCAGLGAGFELGRNDDRAELSRIITQRWSEIADAKARAALKPSPAGEKP